VRAHRLLLFAVPSYARPSVSEAHLHSKIPQMPNSKLVGMANGRDLRPWLVMTWQTNVRFSPLVVGP